MNKFTKIVATIGPASDSEEKIKELILSGVNIFRFNFKHNTVEWHDERIQRVRRVADALKMPVGTLIDLQGPSIRTNQPSEEITFIKGEKLVFGEEVFTTGEKGISLSHPDVIPQLSAGQKLLVNDGLYTFFVEKEGDKTFLRAESDGSMKNKRNVSIPGSTFSFPLLIDRDFEGLQLATRSGVDFVALSFVRTGGDITTLRAEMKKYNLNALIVAKIETQVAIDNLDAIIAQTDAVMVARGDMGVELPAEQVPFYQKLMIKKCIERGIPVITATQMLESMIKNPIPTRAEISDIANAIYDFTDSVMLSGESASGLFPLEAVEVMNKTAEFIEKNPRLDDTRAQYAFEVKDQEQVVADASYNLYLRSKSHDMLIEGFIVFTLSGRTARLISRYRPAVPIFAFAPEQHVVNTLTMNYGVYPLLQRGFKEKQEVTKEEIQTAVDHLLQTGLGKKGDHYILLHGDYWMVQGGTSTIKIITI